MTTINWPQLAGRELTPTETIVINSLEAYLPGTFDSARVTFSAADRYTSLNIEIGDLQIRVQSEDQAIMLGSGMDAAILRLDREKDVERVDRRLATDIRRLFAEAQGLTPRQIRNRRILRREYRAEGRAHIRKAKRAPRSKRKDTPRRDRRIKRRAAKEAASAV